MIVDTIRYRGIKYRRYPDSEARTERVYFTPGIGDRQRGYRRLHEEIWQDANGMEIPTGWEVHHRDENPLNNDPANLECLPSAEHQNGRHGEQHRQRGASPAALANLERIRHLAAAWHASSEGLEWHRQHGREVWANRQVVERTCDRCGQQFTVRSLRHSERFCSNACKSAWRRAAGLDDEARICAACGASFATNRYSKTRTCSRSCGRKLIPSRRSP